MMLPFSPEKSRWVSTGQLVLVLAFETDQYIALRGEQAHRFQRAYGQAQIEGGISVETDSPRFIELLLLSFAHRLPDTLLAFLCLRLAKKALRRQGIRYCLNLLQKIYADSKKSQKSPDIGPAFQLAEPFHPGSYNWEDCLPRSLAIGLFLAATGQTFLHCIGVLTPPFRAHAWVEAEGQRVLDQNYCGLNWELISQTRVG